MPAPIFPTLPSGSLPDSSKFEIELEDNTVSEELEGGYTITRARTTRRGRRIYKVGFTFITEADRAALEQFWETTSGNALIFVWTNPQDNVQQNVRFKGTLSFKYVGRLSEQRWDCDFKVQQA
jgi:phage-related protein